MPKQDVADDTPVERLKDALEYLRDESIRLRQQAVTNAIVRAISIIRAQDQAGAHQQRLH
jgi:hypothetical protein